MIKSFVVLVSLAWPLAEGYGSGAPPKSCADLFPQHGVEAQKTPSPYWIQVSKATINPGQTVDVTIKGGKQTKFQGFMIQARVGNQPVGKFATAKGEAKFVDCLGGSQNTATHTSPTDKGDIKLQWTAPPNLRETVIFTATVLKNPQTFWTGVKSKKVSISV